MEQSPVGMRSLTMIAPSPECLIQRVIHTEVHNVLELRGLLQLEPHAIADELSPILSRFLTEVSNERTASDDPTAPDRTDPAPAQHSEVEPGPPDCLSILDDIFGAVLSCHANHHHSTGTDFPDPATLWPLRPVISWTAAHIFHVNAPLSFGGNSGGADCMFGWVTAFCLLMIATAATVVWSLLDRSRENYAGLHKWFRLFVRFALAGQMIFYGFVKVIPQQMPYPSLTRLLQPFGTLSPYGVLMNSVGSAPAYEIFTGCAMLAGGLLLIVPRTATLGALISLADMILAFMLAMTYDVVAKLLAFHLILLCCFLLAPDVPRLVRFLLLNRTTAPSTQAQLFRGVRANRIALAAQIILGLWLVGVSCHYSLGVWNTRGGGRPLPALYGIWEVKQMSIDEQPRPPLLTDSTRWRRAIFDYPDRMAFQRTGRFVRSLWRLRQSPGENSRPHEEGRQELEGELHVPAACRGSAHPGWPDGQSSGSYGASVD